MDCRLRQERVSSWGWKTLPSACSHLPRRFAGACKPRRAFGAVSGVCLVNPRRSPSVAHEVVRHENIANSNARAGKGTGNVGAHPRGSEIYGFHAETFKTDVHPDSEADPACFGARTVDLLGAKTNTIRRDRGLEALVARRIETLVVFLSPFGTSLLFGPGGWETMRRALKRGLVESHGL